MQPYKINDAFTVVPQSNLINELKLEPRLMKLLCMLAGTPGTLISRDEIIEKIWNGYGGGDEGLTQAISFLRKILNDNNKTIIETVPKSGYIFHGKIYKFDESANISTDNSGVKQRINLNTIIIISIFLLAAIAFIFYKSSQKKHEAIFAPKANTQTQAPSNNFTPEAK